MKLSFLTSLFLTFSLLANSQDTTFYTINGYKAFYASERSIYEINPVDSGSFNAYYLNTNSIALKGIKKESYLNGIVTFYYQNGPVKEIANFDRGRKEGPIERWHANGQKMGEFYLLPFKERKDLEIDQSEKILELYDSLGNSLVNKGTGKGFFLNNKQEIFEQGNIKNGFKDGIWSGELKDHHSGTSMTYRDEYRLGKFVKGESKDLNGNSYTYDKLLSPAEYNGGIKKWGRFLAKNLKYPKQAQRMGVEGRVFIQFFVEKDGSTSNHIVVKGIGAGCDEEALRVVKLFKDWEPGLYRGQIARTKMIQNILFKFK